MRPSGRPLLKWAGGKRQLLPALRPYFPADFNRYLEPFTGSGAVFFDLHVSGQLDGRQVSLTDVNPDLIGCYQVVRDEADAVIARLRDLEQEHRERGAACYYDVRDRRFNPERAARLRIGSGYTAPLAAMLIYLNRTGYNGLFRLNRRGEYNVPAGRYTEPRICDPDHIRAAARALSAATLRCVPFAEVLSSAGAGDFVYCDPPYAPVSRTSNFAQYTASGFGAQDQRSLHDAIVRAARCGATLVLSNSSAPAIVSAYSSTAARDAGLVVHRVPARRAINSQAALRGPVDELIVTNARPRAVDGITPRMVRAGAVTRRPRRRVA
jgi:DNA adenine methylase